MRRGFLTPADLRVSEGILAVQKCDSYGIATHARTFSTSFSNMESNLTYRAILQLQ